MKCENCIHAEVCGLRDQLGEYAEQCEHFKSADRVVKLPCKIGNSVFCLNPNRTFHAVRVDGANVELITSQGFIFNQSLIGKTVFFTREEAERALKERESRAFSRIHKESGE